MPRTPTTGSRRKTTPPRKAPQSGRKHNNQKFYNSAQWRRLAKQVERETNGLCEECKKAGRLKDATGRKGVTDHIIPIRRDWSLRLTRSNLQRLCNKCHNIKSGKEAHE